MSVFIATTSPASAPTSLRERRGEPLVVRHPRMARLEVSFDPERAPVAHDFLDVFGREHRLRAERMPAQVDELATVVARIVRQHEAVVPRGERIGGVERLRVFAVEPHGCNSVTG